MTDLPAIYPAIAFIVVLAMAGLGWCGYYLTFEENQKLKERIKNFYGEKNA